MLNWSEMPYDSREFLRRFTIFYFFCVPCVLFIFHNRSRSTPFRTSGRAISKSRSLKGSLWRYLYVHLFYPQVVLNRTRNIFLQCIYFSLINFQLCHEIFSAQKQWYSKKCSCITSFCKTWNFWSQNSKIDQFSEVNQSTSWSRQILNFNYISFLWFIFIIFF